MKNKKIILIVMIGVVVSGSFIFINRRPAKKIIEKTQDMKTSIEVFTCEKTNLKNFKKFSGNTVAGEIEIVESKALSNISKINVKKGDYVKKGDILMVLDSTKLDEQIADLDKTNEKIQGTINKTKQQMETMKLKINDEKNKKETLESDIKNLENDNSKIELSLQELKEAFEKGEIENSEYEEKKQNLEIQKSNNSLAINKKKGDLKALEININILMKSIEELEKMTEGSTNNELSSMINVLKDKKGDYIVVAGISGVISEMNLKVGSMPINIMKQGIVIENNDTLDVVFKVSDEGKKLFEKGKNINIEIEENGKVFEKVAIVEEISKDIDERTKQYDVIINFKNDEKLKKGAFVRSYIEVNSKQDTLVVPKDALIREDNKTFVYIAKNNEVLKKEIILGVENHKEVEILSGITEGEQVVIKGKEFVEDRSEVNIVKVVKFDENN
ncbi:MAG: efflux RND transporter periplasmic adaptor subunit [Sarcina sp.]